MSRRLILYGTIRIYIPMSILERVLWTSWIKAIGPLYVYQCVCKLLVYKMNLLLKYSSLYRLRHESFFLSSSFWFLFSSSIIHVLRYKIKAKRNWIKFYTYWIVARISCYDHIIISVKNGSMLISFVQLSNQTI